MRRWVAREERLAICFGGMCGCEARSCASTEAYRGRWNGCEGAEVRMIARGGRQNMLRAVLRLAALRGWLPQHTNALEVRNARPTIRNALPSAA